MLCAAFPFQVRWLGGSFGFFSVGLRVRKNTNVPPNVLAVLVVKNSISAL
jgi:hypothetical protein